jgi:hypothetical protein
MQAVDTLRTRAVSAIAANGLEAPGEPSLARVAELIISGDCETRLLAQEDATEDGTELRAELLELRLEKVVLLSGSSGRAGGGASLVSARA